MESVFPDDFFPAVLEKGLPERMGHIGRVAGQIFCCDAIAAKHLPEEGTQFFWVIKGWFRNEKENILTGGFGQDHADDHEPVEIAVGTENAEGFGNHSVFRSGSLLIELVPVREMKEAFPILGVDEVFCKVAECAVHVRIGFTYLLI